LVWQFIRRIALPGANSNERHSPCADTLKNLTNLHTLSLSNNRLKAPILNLSNLHGLCVLHLGRNPLQYFPELSQAPGLHVVSLANLCISADSSFSTWTVEILKPQSRVTMWAASTNDTLKLLLSRSSLQHPLIAGGLAEMARDEELRGCMLRAEKLLSQLIAAMLSEDAKVAAKSCETLCRLLVEPGVAEELERASAVGAVSKLMRCGQVPLQNAGLQVLTEIALASEDVACRMLAGKSGMQLLSDLMLVAQDGLADVQCSALLALSTLAFPQANKLAILSADGCLDVIKRMASRNNDAARKVCCPASGRPPVTSWWPPVTSGAKHFCCLLIASTVHSTGPGPNWPSLAECRFSNAVAFLTF
jgi:hypothetical protein